MQGAPVSTDEAHAPQDGMPPVAKLAAKVAHELNNPLDAVLRFVSLAQRKAKSGDYADLDRHLADAQFGLQRMAEILRELMEIGRETHDALARPRTVEVGELVERAVRACGPVAEGKRMKFVVERRGEVGGKHDLRLLQVLANLLRNAVDAGPEGSVVGVLVEGTEGGGVEIVVRDEGAGIAGELLPLLFSPFVTTKPKGAGHGLGLAISRELVHSLGGTLGLENGSGGGCVATVRVPGRG